MNNQTHQLNNSLSKIKIIYELINDNQEETEEYLNHFEEELKKLEEIFQSLRCNS